MPCCIHVYSTGASPGYDYVTEKQFLYVHAYSFIHAQIINTQATQTLAFMTCYMHYNSKRLELLSDVLSFTAHTSSELNLLLTFKGNGCQTFVSQV